MVRNITITKKRYFILHIILTYEEWMVGYKRRKPKIEFTNDEKGVLLDPTLVALKARVYTDETVSSCVYK